MAAQLQGDGTNVAKWGFEVSCPLWFQRVTRGKNDALDNSGAMTLSTIFEPHRGKPIFEAFKNLHPAEPKLLWAVRQDDLCICNCVSSCKFLTYSSVLGLGVMLRIVMSAIITSEIGLMLSSLKDARTWTPRSSHRSFPCR
jgi:hypothetical protein